MGAEAGAKLKSGRRAAAMAGTVAGTAGGSAGSQPTPYAASMLLALESKVSAARDETELVHLIANELRQLVGGRQALVFKAGNGGRFKVACVSSLVLADKDTPFIRWIEGMIDRLTLEHGRTEAVAFELPAFVDRDAPETRSYPFSQLVWQPIALNSGEAFAGVLIARERPWGEQDRLVIARETAVFGTIWLALHGAKALRPRRWSNRGRLVALAIAALVAGALPVPMTTLAPVEIVAKNPQRVTAPIDGVIKEILVDPNRSVTPGAVLLRFDETTLRNRFKLAEREMLLVQARYERATQASFGDEKARHEIAQARAELALKTAEKDYSAELLARSTIVAERAGVLVYTDRDRLIGRPVRTGERLMQIVAGDEVAARIEVPVADAIVLQKGARARLFLDANPLSAVSARIVSEGYQAEPNSTNQLVYRILAEPDGPRETLRIGARGTAQLLGEYVPLGFYLLRRPISSLRQHLGL